MSAANTALLGATGLLGVVMAAEGVLKFTGEHTAEFERFGYPRWFCYATGALELLGGGALLAGLAVGNAVTMGGGLVVAAVLVGAVATHVRADDSLSAMLPATALLVLAVVVVVAHSAGLLA